MSTQATPLGVGPRLAVGLTSLVAALAVCTVVGGVASRAAVPVVLVTLVAGGGSLVLLRTRLPAPLVVAAVAVAVLLVATAAVLPATTVLGVPTGTTLHLLRHDLGAVRSSLRSGSPYPPAPGLVLLASVLSGMAALFSQLLLAPAGRGRSRDGRLRGLLLSTGLVLYAIALGGILGGTLLATGFLAAAAIALAVPDSRDSASPSASRQWLAPVTVGVAMIVAVLVAGWWTDASAAPGGTVVEGATPATALRLLASVTAVERADPKTVIFTARTPASTYWELGMLTDYRNGEWLPPTATARAVTGDAAPVPSTLVLPGSRTGTFSSKVALASLTGRLVPVPPDTTAVEAPFEVVRTTGGTIAPSGLGARTHYSVTAVVPPPPDAALGGSAPTPPSAELAEDLSLPPLPASIHSLAVDLTAPGSNPFSKAALLENWFRSGSFRYALTPTPSTSGGNGLVAFLTTARVGNCEQFAGAFAVMARSLGLPTRIAVGFTSGTRNSEGSYVVRGIDAHAWPEVYLGTSLGWVSFEPTPSLPAGELTPTDVIGPTGVTISPPVTSTSPATTPTATAPTTPPTVPDTTPATSETTPTSPPSSPSQPTGASSSPLPWIVLALALLGLSGALVFRRRRVTSRDRSVAPSEAGRDAARRVWTRAEGALARAGMRRPPGRSPSGWVAQLEQPFTASEMQIDPPDGFDQTRAVLRDLANVAAVFERTLFADRPLDPGVLSEADAAADRIQRAAREPTVRRQLYDAYRLSSPPRRLARR